MLADLPALEIPHFHWPMDPSKLNDPNLQEYAKITKNLTVWPEFHNDVSIHKILQIKEQTGCTLSGMSSPWHRTYFYITPEGDKVILPPTLRGQKERDEYNYFWNKFERIHNALEEPLTNYFFDCEAWHLGGKSTEYRNAALRKHNLIADLLDMFWPGIDLHWYGRLAVQPSSAPSGWSELDYHTLQEKSANTGCCALYALPEQLLMRQIFKKTLQRVIEYYPTRNQPSTPPIKIVLWVALGSRYRRQTRGYWKWDVNLDFDPYYSWQLGAEINMQWYSKDPERFAPWWGNVAGVVFYPAPFYKKAFLKHFVAYCRGAVGIKDISDLR